ncbi:disulfide bond formation protein DsbA [Cereibacter changlensis JA139]|uniref:Disulfide bond formation protein DsbA n=2 Tax=Cereibacter changlensis TaxID=402884 RepID=A0A2T4JWM1_9RHOB|nr:DsbA family protein [Cereibacter changlensis]PTE22322.1 disulfide bond formation protein DsbA [Cereibacter changlensis JA139]PZX55034.1 protein-disulfide isomerase [Cereibacter changlensis]
MPLTRRSLIAASASLVLAPLALRAQGYPDPGEVLNDPDAPVLGNPQGDVTIVEYFDYQCPYCKRGHPALTEEVAQDGNIRLILKDWPIFGTASVHATRLVLGAQKQGAYAAGLEALMATEGRLSEAQVDRLLTGAGVDLAAAGAAYEAESARWDALLQRNDAQASAFGFMGTPAYIIGMTMFPGAIDRDTLREAIRAARGA